MTIRIGTVSALAESPVFMKRFFLTDSAELCGFQQSAGNADASVPISVSAGVRIRM
jgi:hypothetical protein